MKLSKTSYSIQNLNVVTNYRICIAIASSEKNYVLLVQYHVSAKLHLLM